MRRYGRFTPGSIIYPLTSDTKRAARFTAMQDGIASKGAVLLDSLGSQAAGTTQATRLIVYDGIDNLLATSDEVIIPAGLSPYWQDYTFSFPGETQFVMAAGDFQVGLIVGGPGSGLVRVYGDDPHGAGSRWNNDTYSDGASATFGAATALTADMSAYLLLSAPYTEMRPTADDLYYSRLPFVESQRIFSLDGPDALSARLVDVGWHDTFLDPETGANALVRDGSPLADLLLGQRIRVTSQGVANPKSVYAYVHDLAPSGLAWDLSLTRHLFGQIGNLAATTIETVVTVMG